MAGFMEMHDILHGKVRGNPVGISLFYDEIPEAYQGIKVDPCAIIRSAMDNDDIVHVDREHQDCMTGAFTGGFHEGTEEIRTGQYIARNIEAYTDIAAARTKAGNFVLPPGMVKAIGAAPLNNIPEGVTVDWIVVVCNPHWANFIGAARSVIDGTPPHGAAGTSFCSELFATPWHEDNVVITPGDIGGRMNNRLKPEEMFVIVPMKYTDSMISILSTTPDARAILEATRPADSAYWDKRQRKKEKEAAKAEQAAAAGTDISNDLKLSMDWDEEAQALIRKTPAGILEMAIGNVEDYAEEKGIELITREVIEEQMRGMGMDPAMLG
jgi:uncharacterized protein (DUF169 family)